MKAKLTYHNNGDISIRLHPETGNEMQRFSTVFSRPPGGCKIDEAIAYVESPVLTKDGQEWTGEFSSGNPKVKDGTFSRRIAIGYPE